MITDQAALLEGAKNAIDSTDALIKSAEWLCRFLHENEKRYTWVGVYWVESFAQAGGSADALILGKYFGPETEHTRIAYGSGVCGSSALLQMPIVVPDVRAIDNYLCCSLAVRSEIVVPLFAPDFVGLLDIDSPVLDAFSADDVKLLVELCRYLGRKGQTYPPRID